MFVVFKHLLAGVRVLIAIYTHKTVSCVNYESVNQLNTFSLFIQLKEFIHIFKK